MDFLIKATIVHALFYLCYILFLKHDTFFESNRWFLLLGIIISTCIPFIVIPIYLEAPHFSNIATTATNTTELPLENTSIWNASFITWFYCIGAIILLIKLTLEFYSLYKLLKGYSLTKEKHINFVEIKDAISPFSFFNYIVYNPSQFEKEELKHVINHEKVHVKQYHSIDILIVQLASIVFWFNPIIWLYKKDLVQNLEFIADKNAQGISSCKKSYQHLLLKTSFTNKQLALANNFYNSLIKKRIIMLHKSKSNKLNALKYALILPLLAIFLMSFNTKEIYLESNNITTIEPMGDIEVVVITKDFEESDFKKIKKDFSKKGVTLKFKNIKRNISGEITSLKIEANTEKSSASFNIDSNPEGIKPIKIKYNSDDNSISIGNSNMHSIEGQNSLSYVVDEGNVKIVKSGKGSNVFVVNDNEEGLNNHNVEVIVKDEEGNTKKGSRVYKLKESKVIHLDSDEHRNESVYVFKHNENDSNDNSNVFHYKSKHHSKTSTPLIIIDGKESTMEVLNSFKPDVISSVNVLKDETATKKYGEKGKNGVIIIHTKK